MIINKVFNYAVTRQYMSRDGLRKNSEGNYEHLFSGKWSLGKTTTIKIPEILKDKILSLARYLDGYTKEEVKN